MRRIGKWGARIGISLLVLVIILTSTGVVLALRAWPQVDGTLRVSGLQAPVEVLRDKWGVPNIYAQNEHDLFLRRDMFTRKTACGKWR